MLTGHLAFVRTNHKEDNHMPHFTETTPRLPHEDDVTIYAARVMCDALSKGKLTASLIRQVMTFTSKKLDREIKAMAEIVVRKRGSEIQAPLLARIAELELLLSRSVPMAEAEAERARVAEVTRYKAAVVVENIDGQPTNYSDAIDNLPLPKPKWVKPTPQSWST
jgi:hypothetical protein